MSNKRILPLIIIVIALVLMTIFLVRDTQERKILSLVEEYGGWISMREPYKSNSFDYYNTPENWKETEQLIGQASLKFSSQNQFICEWEPVHSIKGIVWIVTNCAEKLGDHVEHRSAYILFRIGPSETIESFYIPFGEDYLHLVEPFLKNPEDAELNATRLDHLDIRLSSKKEVPPLAYDSKGLLK